MTAALEAWKASVEKSLVGADYASGEGTPLPPAGSRKKKNKAAK
jgi:hypothetical protein